MTSIDPDLNSDEEAVLCFLYVNDQVGFRPRTVAEQLGILTSTARGVLDSLAERELAGTTDEYYHAIDDSQIKRYVDEVITQAGTTEQYRFDTGKEKYPDDGEQYP